MKQKENKERAEHSAFEQSFQRELAWLEKHYAEVMVHAGEWVALDPRGIAGFGKTIEEAEAAAQGMFGANPLLLKVPTEQELERYFPLDIYTRRAAVYPADGFAYPPLTSGEKVLKKLASEKSSNALKKIEFIGGLIIMASSVVQENFPQAVAHFILGSAVAADSFGVPLIAFYSRAAFAKMRFKALKEAMPKQKRARTQRKQKRK